MRWGSFAVALAVAFASLLAAAGCGGGESSADRFDSQLALTLQQTLDDRRETYGVPGVSAAVVVPGEGLWAGASGRESRDGRPVVPATFFNVGSITKTFVAALLVDLAADGVVRLDDPLARWLPGYPNARRITLRELLNHTSGLSDFTVNPAFWAALRSADASTDQRLLTVEGRLSLTPPPLGAPGKSWAYSNSGYLVLGRVIERATGSTVSEQLQRRLLNRLRLRNVVYPAEQPLRGPLAHGHVDIDEDGSADDVISRFGIRAGQKTRAFGWTDGGITATARALARWGHALYGGDVLAPRWQREMLTFRRGPPGGEYGLGVVRDRGLRNTHVRLGHDGNNTGYRSELRHYPDAGVTIAVLWNDEAVPSGLLEYDLARVVLDHVEDETG